MEILRNDNNITIEMLERATQVLELTHYEWRLHERPQPSTKRAQKRQRKAAAVHSGATGFYSAVNSGPRPGSRTGVQHAAT